MLKNGHFWFILIHPFTIQVLLLFFSLALHGSGQVISSHFLHTCSLCLLLHRQFFCQLLLMTSDKQCRQIQVVPCWESAVQWSVESSMSQAFGSLSCWSLYYTLMSSAGIYLLQACPVQLHPSSPSSLTSFLVSAAVMYKA